MKKRKHPVFQSQKIFQEDGKYGLLNSQGVVILEPVYISLRITNKEIDLRDIVALDENGDDNFDREGVGMQNCKIIIADGKQGIALGGGMVLDVKYDLVIKLTDSHYLCKEQTMYLLFDFDEINCSPYLKLLAKIEIHDKLTLTKLMAVLLDTCPDAYGKLSKKLYKHSNGENYISEYRYYYRENYNHDIWFDVATQRVIMFDDFSVDHFDLIRHDYWKESLFR